ncbi:MAG TPA: hypothetical protein PKJ95_02160 [Atribacterota bacterium]|nr:hypothetical protein [Atribacterota bacterium]
MIVDLFTVIVQIVNFLILLFLLKKFLFNRIINIIDERENQIGKQFAEAEQKEKDAKLELEKQRKGREKLEREWEDNLIKIKREIEAERGKMMEEARVAVNEAQGEWERAIRAQRDAFLKELRKLSCQQVFLISKKVLADLADNRLEDQLINSFIAQLEGLDGRQRQEFKRDEFKGSGGQIRKNKVEINTAFPLSEEAKDLLIRKVKQLVDRDALPVFYVYPDLICGIELKTESKKIAWSMEHYLDLLEMGFEDIFMGNKEIVNLKDKQDIT